MIREQKIDFVIAWVDGSDLEWQKEKNKYANPGDTTLQVDASMVRYREWDTLRYWFRAVEKYAPWVNQVYFVTCGHVPKWLNMDAPKLHFVRHQDYIPEQYLPTFSSHPIELNLHRIMLRVFSDNLQAIQSYHHAGFQKEGIARDMVYQNGRYRDMMFMSILAGEGNI